MTWTRPPIPFDSKRRKHERERHGQRVPGGLEPPAGDPARDAALEFRIADARLDDGRARDAAVGLDDESGADFADGARRPLQELLIAGANLVQVLADDALN